MKENLSEVYKQLLTEAITPKEASEIIKSPEVQQSINTYINKAQINNLIPYFEEDLQNIYLIILITQFIFNYSGEDTGISDTTYDKLYEIMLNNGGADVISVPITPSYVNITSHKYPSLRGTLTKVHHLTDDEERTNKSRKYLDEWKRTMENKIYEKTGEHIDLDYEEVYVFPKFDGCSCIFEINDDNSYGKALTRGFVETNEAQDVTHVFQNMKKRKNREFPPNTQYGLKTEVMMHEKDFDYFNNKYGTDYKNTRSIVSAIMNSQEYEKEKSDLLQVIPLRVGTIDGKQELAKEVFDYPYLRCLLKDREAIRNFANSHSYVNGGLRCDGAVIYIINPRIQDILGRENDKNNYEVAYKFTEEVAFSELKDIEFRTGLFGRIAPVAIVKPVKLKGNKIRQISLGSIGRLRGLKLRKGDTVKVLYDIIPYLSFDSECKHNMDEDIIDIPDKCPDCGSTLEFSDSGAIATCINDNCPCRKKGKILNFLFKMNIENISYGAIDKLYNNGIIRDIPDLYKLDKKVSQILEIDGIGIDTLNTWIKEINDKSIIEDYQLLGSLGIEGCSKKTFESIMKMYTLDELINEIVPENKISALIKVSGIKDKKASKIMNGLWEASDLVTKLCEVLTIIDSKGIEDKYDFSVYFTNVRDTDAEEFIKQHNGKVADSFNKKVNFLVVPSLDNTSKKIPKAKQWGIPIVHIDDIYAVLTEFMGGTT